MLRAFNTHAPVSLSEQFAQEAPALYIIAEQQNGWAIVAGQNTLLATDVPT